MNLTPTIHAIEVLWFTVAFVTAFTGFLVLSDRLLTMYDTRKAYRIGAITAHERHVLSEHVRNDLWSDTKETCTALGFMLIGLVAFTLPQPEPMSGREALQLISAIVFISVNVWGCIEMTRRWLRLRARYRARRENGNA